MTTAALLEGSPLSSDSDNVDGLGLGGVAPEQCPRKAWCLSPAGHRGNCRKYTADDPRRKKGGHSRAGRRRAEPGPARTSSAAPPRRARSKSNVLPAAWSMMYSGVGQAIETQAPEPAGPPVGRVMQFQAPIAGERIHALMSKVPVYRQATALAGGGILDDILELVAAPLLVGIMSTSEQAREMLWPVLATSLQNSAVSIARMQKQQAEAMRDMGEFSDEAGEIMRILAEQLFAPRPTYGSGDDAPAG